MLKRRLLLAILLLVSAPSTAHGQQLVAGEVIRVRSSEGPWTEATMVRMTRDSLWYQSGASMTGIPADDAEIRRPRSNHWWWLGIGVGGAVGGVIGAVVGASMSPGDQFMTVYPESNCKIGNFFNPPP